MNCRLSILLTVLILSSVSLNGQLSFTLKEAQKYAVQNSYTSVDSQLNIENAERKVKETIAIGLPQINASGTFQNFLDIPVNVFPDFISPSVYNILVDEDLIPEDNVPEFGTVPAQFGTEYNVNAGLSVSQLIFSGTYLVGLQATRAYVDLRRFQHNKTVADIEQSVASAYYGVLVAEENVKILSESKSTLEKSYTEVQELYKEGFVEEQDAEQLELTISQINSNILNAERQFINMMDLLKFQLGLPLIQDIQLSDNLDDMIDLCSKINPTQLSLSLQDHPDYQIAESNLGLQNINLKNEKTKYYPTLGAFFEYAQSAQRNEFDIFSKDGEWFPQTLWGLNFNLPIFSSGMKKNVVKQAEIEVMKAENLEKQVTESLKLAEASSKSNYLFALDNLKNQKRSVEIAKSIRDKTNIKYQEGISSSFELNQIESQYLEAQGNYIQAVLALLEAKSELDKALNIQ